MRTIVASPAFLIAVAHPGRLNVYRSPVVRARHSLFNPVSEYIQEHGLVLAMSETFEDDDWMFGSVISELYTRPENRADILTLELHVDTFDACGVCDHFHDIDSVHHMTEPGGCAECTGFHRH